MLATTGVHSKKFSSSIGGDNQTKPDEYSKMPSSTIDRCGEHACRTRQRTLKIWRVMRVARCATGDVNKFGLGRESLLPPLPRLSPSEGSRVSLRRERPPFALSPASL